MNLKKRIVELRPDAVEWARANGLEPDEIADDVEIVNGRFIRYRERVVGPDGAQTFGAPRLVPLKVPPAF
ncbi:hypothetical protein [Streptomyces sp. NPDC053755]|uniref:hypothetical protein n=1 Tax=Streptomyces sp. NPDC053755 TaxID=3155815 RepID=UPI003419BA71